MATSAEPGRRLDELAGLVGEVLGPSSGILVDQARIAAFAEATEDRQWIHLDAERAARSPYGTTIAHGFLTLSLVSMLVRQVWRVDGVAMVINYGCNRVRFPAPVPVGSRIRAGVVLKSVDDVSGGVQVINEVTIEREGGDKPCCVAETVSRIYV